MTIRKVGNKNNKADGDLYVDQEAGKLYVALSKGREDSDLTEISVGSPTSLNTSVWSANTSGVFSANRIHATKCMCHLSGSVSRMGAFLVAASGTTKFAIYSDNNGEPDELLGQTDALSPSYQGDESVALTSPLTLLAGTNYWVAQLASVAISVAFNSSNGTSRYKDIGVSTFPETWPASTDVHQADWYAFFAM